MTEPVSRYLFRGETVRLIGKSHFERQRGRLVFESEKDGGIYVLKPDDSRLGPVPEDLYLRVSWEIYNGTTSTHYVKMCPEAIQEHKISKGTVLAGRINPDAGGMPRFFLVEEIRDKDSLPPNHHISSNILLYSISLTPLPCRP